MFYLLCIKRTVDNYYFTVQQNTELCCRPMNPHEKHQYHFEKYLRNEMPADERMAFDEKLSADASLRMAFEYYKLNRQELLQNLIEDHNLIRKDDRFNKLILLLISLTGIALTFNYFVYRDNHLQTVDTAKPKNIFIRYIPFLNWEKDKKSIPPADVKTDTGETQTALVVDSNPIARLEPSVDGEERLASDQFLSDTFIAVLDINLIEQLRSITPQTDSSYIDSVNVLVHAQTAKNKTTKVLVEFWQSPVHYSGYLFAQNKLILYGVPFGTPVYIYKKNNQLVAILPAVEIELIEQPNFTSF